MKMVFVDHGPSYKRVCRYASVHSCHKSNTPKSHYLCLLVKISLTGFLSGGVFFCFVLFYLVLNKNTNMMCSDYFN